MPIIVLPTGSSIRSKRTASPLQSHSPRRQSLNQSNRAAVEAIFAVPENSSLAKAGCALRYADGDVECTGNPGPVGALLPDGRRFDLALPFSFPFRDIVKGLQK